MRRSFRLKILLVGIAALLAPAAVHMAAQGKKPPPLPTTPPPPGYIDPRYPPKEDPNYKAPRTAFGDPSFEGMWQQASSLSNYSLEDPEGARDEHVRIGGQRPAIGRPIIDPPDGMLPYQPWAREYATFLDAQHKKPAKPEYLDPVARGFQDGLPRAIWGGFQIQQFLGYLVMTHPYDHQWRVIHLDGRPHIGKTFKLWMGDSVGHWEGPNSLVVDVTNNTDQVFIDLIGTFHSDQMHLVERWTLGAPDHLTYIATIEDPSVYTQPWKLRVDLTRTKVDEQWESAVWEGNKLGWLPVEFWGDAKKADIDPVTGEQLHIK
jgi:hypothetical protein